MVFTRTNEWGIFFRQDSLQSEAEKSMKKATRCEKTRGHYTSGELT